MFDNDKHEDTVDKPFSGVSEVRTVSSPSGFRSSNEQVYLIISQELALLGTI